MYDKDLVVEISAECRECDWCEDGVAMTPKQVEASAQEHANETGHSVMLDVGQTIEINPE